MMGVDTIIIRMVKNFLYKIVQIARLTILEKKYECNIYSWRASCRAKYGKKVSIEERTFVASNVEIGDYSYVNSDSWIENCVIGRYCSISDHVMIGPSEHNIDAVLSHPILGLEAKKEEKIVIGNDVLISHGATILSGNSVGDGAVIAAGAIVTKDIPPYEIWGGVPAKKIKNRWNDLNKIKRIKLLNLYDMNPIEIRKINEEAIKSE